MQCELLVNVNTLFMLENSIKWSQ